MRGCFRNAVEHIDEETKAGALSFPSHQSFFAQIVGPDGSMCGWFGKI